MKAVGPRILIAGASGYIGRALIPALLKKFPDSQIIALSRSSQESSDPRIEWKACDLFSLKSVEDVMPTDLDLAFYLVHSMGPTAHLDQGSFADYDLILADNFARALKKTRLTQVIYLGGLIPENSKLSQHLESRLEVEWTFSQYNLPVTIFRAGLIIGEQGSSFQIMIKLVKRLPVMICPKWAQTLTTPVDLQSVVKALSSASLERAHVGRSYDLAACRSLTYVEMMRRTGQKMGLKRFLIAVPFFTPTLSRLWVRLITNTPKDLVYPLVESLEHEMVARPDHLFPGISSDGSYDQLLEKTSLHTLPSQSIFKFRAQRRTVRSVQRLHLPEGKNAVWVKDRYVEWLPRFLNPMIKINRDGNTLSFSLFAKKLVMLQLSLSSERSSPDRQVLYIRQGLLVAKKNQGRLEFRVVLNRRFVLAAIHEYQPALPWYIYKYTQALLHLFVMKAFDRHLQGRKSTSRTGQ